VWNKSDRWDLLEIRSKCKHKLSPISEFSPKIVPKASTTAHIGRYKGDPIGNILGQSNFHNVFMYVRIVELLSFVH
jgi:hypothetical protein